MNLLTIAWQGVTAFPVRSLLTSLSLLVGIIGIVSVYSASITVEAALQQRALLAGGPQTTVDVVEQTGRSGLEETRRLAQQMETYFAPDASVALVLRLSSAVLIVGAQPSETEIFFVDSGLREIRPFPVVDGQWLSERSEFLVPRIVVNTAAVKRFDISIGDSVTIRIPGVTSDLSALVSGIVVDGSPAPTSYANIHDSYPFLAANVSDLVVGFELSSPTVSVSVAQRRINELAEYSGSGASWNIQQRDTLGALAAELHTTQSTFLWVGLLGLITAALAISNVGLSALRQRASELSLRRAIGARGWHIPVIMILESQLLALIAGALAVPASVAIYPWIISQFGAPFGVAAPSYPWHFALVGLVVGMVTALVGSLAPAIRSLRVPIANIMRE